MSDKENTNEDQKEDTTEQQTQDAIEDVEKARKAMAAKIAKEIQEREEAKKSAEFHEKIDVVIKNISKRYRNKRIRDILDTIALGCSVVQGIVGALGKYPVLQFIALPLEGFFRVLTTGLKRAAIAFDPDSLQGNDKQHILQYPTSFHKGSTYFGCLSGVAILTAVIFPVIAPVALIVAAFSLFASNVFGAVAETIGLRNVIKSTESGGVKKLLIASQCSRLTYAGFGSLSIGLFATSLVVAVAFPPAGAFLLMASAVCAVVGFLGLVAAFSLDWFAKRANRNKPDTEVVNQTNTLSLGEKNEVKVNHQHKLEQQVTVGNEKAFKEEKNISKSSKIKECVARKFGKFTPMKDGDSKGAEDAPQDRPPSIRPNPSDE